MKRNDRAIVGFTMLAHAMFHTYELAIPIFVTVWLDAFATTEAALGIVVGAGYALIGLGALPSGILADAYGSKRLVLGSAAGMGGGFLLVSLAPNVVVLGAALVLWGAGASLYHPAGLSLLSRGTENRGTAFAYHGVAGNVGTVVGPLAAAVLLSYFDWRLVAALFVAPALVAGAIAFRLSFDERAATESAEVAADGDPGRTVEADGGLGSLSELVGDSRALFTGGFTVVFAVVMLYGLYYRGILTFLPEILGGLPLLEPVTVAGRSFQPSRYVYAGLLFVGMFGQYAGGKVSDVVETERALVVTFAALVVGALLFVPASSAGVAPLLAVCVLLGFFVYVAAPVYQATIADYVTADSHGLSYGFTYLAMFGVGALGAAMAGTVLTYAGSAALFAALAALAVLAGLLSVYLLVR
ncbi:MFS transporter [Haladaptatus salinisoli]|uniref:MFS transporter n=1 Tax=Haladaptatus salinisoli TaxID=2884876 RepID=UPI001D0A4C91|nr:MFS transporter [Haladaptatus salinisoli]